MRCPMSEHTTPDVGPVTDEDVRHIEDRIEVAERLAEYHMRKAAKHTAVGYVAAAAEQEESAAEDMRCVQRWSRILAAVERDRAHEAEITKLQEEIARLRFPVGGIGG